MEFREFRRWLNNSMRLLQESDICRRARLERNCLFAMVLAPEGIHHRDQPAQHRRAILRPRPTTQLFIPMVLYLPYAFPLLPPALFAVHTRDLLRNGRPISAFEINGWTLIPLQYEAWLPNLDAERGDHLLHLINWARERLRNW